MRFDKELARELMLAVERRSGPGFENIDIAGHTKHEVDYHTELLVEARLLKAHEAGGFDGTCWYIDRPTYAGHEFLDTVRDNEVWRRTKETAGKIGGGSISMLAEIAKATVKMVLKEHLGVDLG